MTAPDDLHVNQWIAVVKAPQPASRSFFGWSEPDDEPTPYNGQPLKILAISFPFICVTDGTNRGALDVRAIQVQAVGEKYAQAMMGTPSQTKKRREKDNLPGTSCPRCRGRLKQTLKEGESEWKERCEECGWAKPINLLAAPWAVKVNRKKL